jgi:hypothetical protein
MYQFSHRIEQVQIFDDSGSESAAVERLLELPQLDFGLVDRNTLLGRFSKVADDLHDLWNRLDIGVVLHATIFERFEYVGEKKVVSEQSRNRTIDEVMDVLTI